MFLSTKLSLSIIRWKKGLLFSQLTKKAIVIYILVIRIETIIGQNQKA